MADTEPRAALAGLLRPGIYGADGTPGVALSEAPAASLIHVAGDAVGASAVLGTDLPTAAGAVAGSGDVRILWLGPDTWLVKAPAADFGHWAARISASAPAAAINDVTHGRTTVLLEGANARDVLAAGCPLDFDESAFAPGRCAASLLGHLNVLIECTGADTFEVTVTRSYGADLFSWLRDAAAEFGYRIA